MQLQAVSERKYYEDQAGPLATILRRAWPRFVAVIMGIGAVFGAMNTMYAIVAARTREIGTLRALGFSRRAILFSFVLESVFLALVGGVLGCLLALPHERLLHGHRPDRRASARSPSPSASRRGSSWAAWCSRW